MKRTLLALALLAAGCATPPPSATDPVIAQLSSSARAAYARGELRKAEGFYEQALREARSRDDRAELPAVAMNLAACRLALGRPADAAPLLAEARRERLQAGQPIDDLDLMDASRLRAQGDLAGAAALANTVAGRTKDPARAREAAQLAGLLAVQGGDAAALGAALAKLAADHDPLTELLRGESLALRFESAAAAAQFDRAAEAYRKAGRLAEMTDALARAGAAHQRGGQAAAAADRYYRAARSAFARGDVATALKHLNAGMASFDQQADAPTRDALTNLLREIEQAMPAGAARN